MTLTPPQQEYAIIQAESIRSTTCRICLSDRDKHIEFCKNVIRYIGRNKDTSWKLKQEPKSLKPENLELQGGYELIENPIRTLHALTNKFGFRLLSVAELNGKATWTMIRQASA